MKKIIIILSWLLVAGCASLERSLIKDIVDTGKVSLNRCEVEGFEYGGVDSALDGGQVLKLLMIHGVGTHHPGYSMRLQENLAGNIGFNVVSRLPKNVTLLDPADGETEIGNLRVTYWQNKASGKRMLFYELTWSMITAPDKEIIAFDTEERYSKFRVPFNNTMKVFLDNTLPDPLVYEVDRSDLILKSGKQSLCWMLKTGWNDVPDGQKAVCALTPEERIAGLAGQNLMFVTHSLGSKILMDTLTAEADEVAAAGNRAGRFAAVRKLQQKEITVFMLANQLPILQIGHPLPKIHNQTDAYCFKGGSRYGRRLFKGVNIVAFSDPNDILSYAIPQTFADKYLDSRICPRVTNVSVNVAPEISAFGFGVVDPVAAHTEYDNSPKVINLITRGTLNFGADEDLNGQCRFIRMEKDNKMR